MCVVANVIHVNLRAGSRPSSRYRVYSNYPLVDIRGRGGGKSGLHRAECQVTPGRREPTESAAENIPPKQFAAGKGEMVR